tara:strand:+ start:670 stop:933 length:264 start_codon:yes stop_codon:yes gene_type:complete
MQYLPDPAFENNPYLTNYPGINSNLDEGLVGMTHQCDNPNPPPWCENYNVPVDVGPLGLAASIFFCILLLIKRNESRTSNRILPIWR